MKSKVRNLPKLIKIVEYVSIGYLVSYKFALVPQLGVLIVVCEQYNIT